MAIFVNIQNIRESTVVMYKHLPWSHLIQFCDCLSFLHRFAEVMIENLRHHNCDLLGKDACYSLETQKQRFLDCGFYAAAAVNVWDAYQNLPFEILSRIEKIEFLDEFEVMKQLLEHYCVAWGWKDDAELGFAQIVIRFA